MRVANWRYTCWFVFDRIRLVPRTDSASIIGRELYNHTGDTGLDLNYPSEVENLVDKPNLVGVVERLHAMILNYIRS